LFVCQNPRLSLLVCQVVCLLAPLIDVVASGSRQEVLRMLVQE
jgi:hypothetical protein